MISTHPSAITTWQAEQLDAFQMVRAYLAGVDSDELERLLDSVSAYLDYRHELDTFLMDHFSHICTRNCYTNSKSACCGKDSIIIFFAEVVINALISVDEELDLLIDALRQPNQGLKCTYLGPEGCLWRLRPVVCALFLCDPAEREVFSSNRVLHTQWYLLKEREKAFQWPDRPVLFDDLEKLFITAGYESSLMYCHTSPGLLRVKRAAGREHTVSLGGKRSGQRSR